MTPDSHNPLPARRRIYVASSWRNEGQPEIVRVLREQGHEVYDFRNPTEGNTGFAWSDIDPDWEAWSPRPFRDRLDHPVAVSGFGLDFDAMKWADTFVLALPCGRSAHLEAGWAIGQGKPTAILLHADKFEPELMYRMADLIACDLQEVTEWVAALEASRDDLTQLRDAWNAHMATCPPTETDKAVAALTPTREDIDRWINAPSDTASALEASPSGHDTLPARLREDNEAYDDEQAIATASEVVQLLDALREVPRAYENRVLQVLDYWLPAHTEGCDEGSTQRLCLRCDVFANMRVAFGFAGSLALLGGEE